LNKIDILDSIPDFAWDQNSACLEEIMAAKGMNHAAAQRLRNAKIESGEWEQVWKKYHGRRIKAYRLKK
jgi:hypothetical protein